MKKTIAMLAALLLAVAMAGCAGGKFTDLELEVPEMKVASASVTQEGKLFTACAADTSRNDPAGQNQSPALSWDAVDGTAGYVVVMFDQDANWLHWLAQDVEETSLTQGACTQTDTYVGPYPPGSSEAHRYRIEVFAVARQPGEIAAKMDAVNQYADIVSVIDGGGGNILARGHIVATYAHGDDTA